MVRQQELGMVGDQDQEFFRQRGFGLRIGFGQRPALLVIDMVKAFTNPAMMLGAGLDAQIEAISPLLGVAHERGIPVIFSTVMYHESDFKDAGIWALKQKGVVTLQAGTDGVEVDPRLDFRSTDSLLVKKYASCFFGTDLVSRLMSRQVDTLVITGCTTSGCAPRPSMPCRRACAPWWSARRSAIAQRPPTSRACSISMPNMPMSCRWKRRCTIFARSATMNLPSELRRSKQKEASDVSVSAAAQGA